MFEHASCIWYNTVDVKSYIHMYVCVYMGNLIAQSITNNDQILRIKKSWFDVVLE